MECINLAQDRDKGRALVTTVMNLRIPSDSINFLTTCRIISFSRRTLCSKELDCKKSNLIRRNLHIHPPNVYHVYKFLTDAIYTLQLTVSLYTETNNNRTKNVRQLATGNVIYKRNTWMLNN
jgi:hypothetical protein